MEHDVEIQVTLVIDGTRRVFDIEPDCWADRGSNPIDDTNLSFEIVETIQRALFDADGIPRVEAMK